MQIQERAVGTSRFNPLSQSRIRMNPDYKVMVDVGVYNLTITDPEKYNGTKYRCHGFADSEEALDIYSSVSQVLVIGELHA